MFGRRIFERTDEKSGKKKFYASNRTFAPMPVTKNLNAEKLTKSEFLTDEINAALQKFLTADDYEFDDGNWSYTAKPVRARQSCLECHTDYVLLSPPGKKPFKFRRRAVGDAIGVLL